MSHFILTKKAFNSLEYEVLFFNITSQTEMPVVGKVKIAEVGDDWIKLSIPKNSCAMSHKLLVHIIRKYDVKKLTRGILRGQIPFALSIMGDVVECDSSQEKSVSIRFQFTQFSRTEWNKFVGKWKSIQARVDQQFKEMKE